MTGITEVKPDVSDVSGWETWLRKSFRLCNTCTPQGRHLIYITKTLAQSTEASYVSQVLLPWKHTHLSPVYCRVVDPSNTTHICDDNSMMLLTMIIFRIRIHLKAVSGVTAAAVHITRRVAKNWCFLCHLNIGFSKKRLSTYVCCGIIRLLLAGHDHSRHGQPVARVHSQYSIHLCFSGLRISISSQPAMQNAGGSSVTSYHQRMMRYPPDVLFKQLQCAQWNKLALHNVWCC